MNNRSCVFVALCAVLVFSSRASAFKPRVNEHAKRIADFEARVAAYLDLHKKAVAGPQSKLTNSPEDIASRQSELAARIRALRATAKQGDIFTPGISAEFRRLIRISWKDSDGANMKSSLKHAEPVRITLRVNSQYPRQVPLQSTPPTLLQNLPAVPKELEYRVVSHRLVLRDIAADLIVDFTGDFVP